MANSCFTFRYPEWRALEPAQWVVWWSDRYGVGDNPEYFALIEKQGKLSAEDFEQVGRWKESCLKPGNGRWKPRTPVGYAVWMQARAELPTCPEKAGIPAFLSAWSVRKFDAGSGQEKSFGLSRATTLLHFVSGGEYPILDSRVVSAMKRLGAPIVNADTAEGYLHSHCLLFTELAAVCGVSGVEGLRKLDNALFNYGAETSFPSGER